jgi:hypothetical protein
VNFRWQRLTKRLGDVLRLDIEDVPEDSPIVPSESPEVSFDEECYLVWEGGKGFLSANVKR